MEKVADVLRHKYPQFNSTSSRRKITEALHQMHCENVDYLIVLDEERFMGILTEHDIAEKVLYRSGELEHATVKEFMSTYLPVATTNDTLEYCMQLMERYNVRHVAIYDRFNFKGVVSSHDLMKQALSKRRNFFEEENASELYTWSY
ncbi:CBS domain-containing protein [Flaviaesturariibacter aridisoli]|uniref:CBS domain-containing protein n=1 Tax=Flaviaesturariibacter aridisoli TaxID=2545761 RepID=A0A4R4E1A9_9BACT|nr:CBS domain-containing protein [Flaviaesturariibacter aridisoli]TCZ73254.1 CBS domain-containing protein [Flaviaesturariibacter aridisoli]